MAIQHRFEGNAIILALCHNFVSMLFLIYSNCQELRIEERGRRFSYAKWLVRHPETAPRFPFTAIFMQKAKHFH